MKSKKLLFQVTAIILSVVFIFSFCGMAFAQTSIPDTRNSVVRVVVFRTDTEPNEVISMGTGFVVGDEEPFEYVATNLHVANPWLFFDDRGEVPKEVFVYRSRDDLLPATIHVELPRVDMALLRLDPEHLLHGYEPMELGRRDMVTVGDTVVAIGFPAAAGTDFPLPWGSIGLSDFPAAYPEDTTVTSGVLSKMTTFDGVGYYQMDASVNPGNSGGPLVNEHGQVIGMVTLSMFAEGIHGAFQIDYLTDILRSRGIAHKTAVDIGEPADPPEEVITEPEDEVAIPAPVEEGTDQNMLIIGLGAAALLIIVLAFILFSRRKKPAVATPSQPFPSSHTQQATAAAAGPVTRTRPESAPAVTQAKRKEPRPVIKSIAGHFSGQTLELVENQLIVGRDPRLSQLVYPQQREEISRKHLTIRFDERTQKFSLVDSSSNGTYLSSNQKLEPGETYYLNSGERFYLADPNEVFEVKVES